MMMMVMVLLPLLLIMMGLRRPWEGHERTHKTGVMLVRPAT